MDLNTDCQLSVLDQLDLSTILTLSETSKHFSFLAAEILRQKFATKLVAISIPCFAGALEHNVVEMEDKIRMQNNRAISLMLEHYGHLIAKLSLDHHYSPDRGADLIYSQINVYCSETLRELHISSKAAEHFIDEFVKPFKKVEVLSLGGVFNKLGDKEYDFSEIFPSLRCLTLSMTYIDDATSIVRNSFPHLEHLEFVVWKSRENPSALCETMIRQLLTNNPHIRSVNLHNVSPKLIKFLADEMQNLKSLEIVLKYGTQNDEIHFEHLKILKIPIFLHYWPANVTFSNIEEFETSADDFVKLMKMIENIQTLKKLKITRRLGDNEILRLAEIDPNVAETSLECDPSLSGESVMKLLENWTHLIKMELRMSAEEPVNSTMDAFRKKLDQNWKIYTKRDGIFLERRTQL